MVNVTRHDAVGASFLKSVDWNGTTFSGVKVHYRRWFNQRASVETALGVPTSGATGVLGLVKISPVNWVGLALRPTLLRYDYPGERRHFDASAGLEFSGPPALVASTLGLIGVLVHAFSGVR